MNQLLVHIAQWIIAIPFFGFIFCIIFFVFFLPLYGVAWWLRFNAISKVARQEGVEWKYFCAPVEGYERAFFPDCLIKPEDSVQMIQVKKRFISLVKLGWKIVIWWMFTLTFCILAAAGILSLSH